MLLLKILPHKLESHFSHCDDVAVFEAVEDAGLERHAVLPSLVQGVVVLHRDAVWRVDLDDHVHAREGLERSTLTVVVIILLCGFCYHCTTVCPNIKKPGKGPYKKGPGQSSLHKFVELQKSFNNNLDDYSDKIH